MFNITENVASHLSAVIREVVKYGSDQHYEFGLQLKLTHSQIVVIEDRVSNSQQKLRQHIETRRLQVVDETVTHELLDACRNISFPIIGTVLQELRRVGEIIDMIYISCL